MVTRFIYVIINFLVIATLTILIYAVLVFLVCPAHEAIEQRQGFNVMTVVPHEFRGG